MRNTGEGKVKVKLKKDLNKESFSLCRYLTHWLFYKFYFAITSIALLNMSRLIASNWRITIYIYG